jgi:hypothetical protein
MGIFTIAACRRPQHFHKSTAQVRPKLGRMTGSELLQPGHFAQNPDESVWDRCDDALEAHDGSYVDFVKYFSNRSCDRFAPSSVKTTDFAFVAGSEM